MLTISDGVAEGTREDESGETLAALLGEEGYEVERRIVPDDRDAIAEAIAELAEDAARRAHDRRHGPRPARRHARRRPPRCSSALAPGIAEALRADSLAKTPHALLSRGLAGVRGQALVVNLPGSPGGCRDGFEVLRPALKHAVELLAGEPTAHIARHDRPRVPGPLLLARQVRAHDLRAAVRLRRRLPGRRRRAERARPGLDHGRDGRRPLAGDGAEPPDRRRPRRAQPAHRRSRAARQACSRRLPWSPSARPRWRSS